MRIARLAAGTLAAAALLVVPAAAGAAQVIQPGAYHETGGSACTLNFIYDGQGDQAGKVYAGTAAHCVTAVGDAVHDLDGDLIGTVAAFGDADFTETDWGFIEIDAGALDRVDPGMKGSPQFPTGVTTAADTLVGDRIAHSGYGLGFDIINTTRERRQAVLTYDDAEIYTVLGAMIFGDSGGPVVHVPSGRALGIVSRLCIGPCEDEGPTVEGLLAKAAAAGLQLTLRTVPSNAARSRR